MKFAKFISEIKEVNLAVKTKLEPIANGSDKLELNSRSTLDSLAILEELNFNEIGAMIQTLLNLQNRIENSPNWLICDTNNRLKNTQGPKIDLSKGDNLA